MCRLMSTVARFLALVFAALPFCPPATAKAPRDPFLEEIQRRAFLFFWNETDSGTGLTKDRAHNFGKDDYDVGSIAATGFALSALPIGVEHGWVSRDKARERALVTLRFFEERAPEIRGIYPHFLKLKTGERAWNSEYSTIDTTLLVCGALTAGQYFGGDVQKAARRLNERVDWRYWSPRKFISHGSRPEEGEFLAYDYGGYSEAMLMYVIAIGSPSHPVPASMWKDLGRHYARYGPFSSIAGSSLFVNQYPNLWVDFKGKDDGLADYWENARTNTLANRLFAINNAGKYKGWGPDVWGLTAGDSPDGYSAWAAEPGGAHTNGTINPHAAGGSYMLTPVESRRALRTMLDRYRSRIWGRYGFSDGFNVGRDWWDKDVIGIDTGATMLSIENHRTGLIHRLFMQEPSVKAGMQRIGLTKTPTGGEARAISGLVTIAPGATRKVTFRASAPEISAKGLLLYGGVAEQPVEVHLNGKRLGTSPRAAGHGQAAAFAVPARLLKQTSTLEIRNRGDKPVDYGPLQLGPRTALEARPLVPVTVR